MKKEEAVKLWKELGVGYAKFEFICGGDSMGDTETFLYKEDGTEIEFCFQKDDEGKIIDNEENKVVEQKIIDVRDLKDYIDNVIYNYVDFYVNSDGHYIGESGFVEVRLDEEDEEDVDFTFIKEAESEWEESVSNEVLIKLKPKQIKFIKEYVRDINGDYDGMVINYKKDVLLKDETEKMIEEIESARKSGDTLGGVVEVIGFGLMPGLGSHVHWDRRLDSKLAAALMGIQAIKGVEVGDGFRTAARRGSVAHDEIEKSASGEIRRRTDRAGGTEGGMSNGELLRVRAAMKPISTVPRALDTIDVATGEPAKAINQRSDVCAVPAAGVIAEAMVALVLAEALLEKFGGDSVAETKRNVDSYRASLKN